MDHPKIRTDGSGNLYLNFGEYGQEVEVACFSGDGKRLLTIEEVGVARIWELGSKQPVGEIRPTSPLAGSKAGPTNQPFQVFIEAAALDRTGEVALLGLNDGTAGFFSVADGSRRTTFHHPDRQPAEGWELIRAVNFSPDGSLAVIGFYRRCVGVWDVATGQMVALLRSDVASRLHRPSSWGRDTLVSSVAVSADNRHVFAGHADMTATLWELGTGEVVFDAYEHQEKILALWHGNETVRWATSGGVVWEGSPQGCVRRLDTGESWHESAIAPDGQFLLVRTASGQVKRWSSSGESEVLADLKPKIHSPSDARSLGFVPGGRAWFYPLAESRLAVASRVGRAELACNPGHVEVAFDRGGGLLASYNENRLQLWSVPSGNLLGELVDGKDVGALALSPDGSLLATGTLGRVRAGDRGPPRTISLWDVASRQLLHRWPAHAHQVSALAFLPDGQHLVSTSLDRSVKLWRLPTSPRKNPVVIAKLEYDDLERHHLAVLSDGRIVVFRSGGIEVWRGLQGKLVDLPAAIGYSDRWLVSDDEQALVLARGRQVVDVWSLQTGQLLSRHTADITRPDILPDRRLLADRHPIAGGYLWRTVAGNFIHVGDGPRGWATPLQLSPNGRFVVLPCRESAILVELGQEPRVMQEFPFEGKLRASCVTEERVLAVNSAGRVFGASRIM